MSVKRLSSKMDVPRGGPAAASDEPVVYVVDDDEAVVGSLEVMLASVGHAVRGFTSPRRFLQEVDPCSAGCVILDERMPEMSGHVLHSELSKRGGTMPILLCTGYAEVDYAVDEMRKGAFTVLQKPIYERVLVDAVADALWQDACNREIREKRQAFEDRLMRLTTRQREIMEFVVRGHPSRVIAQELGVSERTIELHRARILRVMGVKSTIELAFAVASYGAGGGCLRGGGVQ